MANVSALEWAIFSRFTAYVRSLPDGTVELLGSAAWTANGGILFPLAETDGDGVLRFFGGIRFEQGTRRYPRSRHEAGNVVR